MCMGADSSKSDGGMTGAAKDMHRSSSPSTDDVDYVVGGGSGSSSSTTSSGSASSARTLLTARSASTIPRSSDQAKTNRQMTQPFNQRDGRKQRTNVFKGLGRVATSLLKMSPAYQVISGLSKTYKGN